MCIRDSTYGLAEVRMEHGDFFPASSERARLPSNSMSITNRPPAEMYRHSKTNEIITKYENIAIINLAPEVPLELRAKQFVQVRNQLSRPLSRRETTQKYAVTREMTETPKEFDAFSLNVRHRKRLIQDFIEHMKVPARETSPGISKNVGNIWINANAGSNQQYRPITRGVEESRTKIEDAVRTLNIYGKTEQPKARVKVTPYIKTSILDKPAIASSPKGESKTTTVKTRKAIDSPVKVTKAHSKIVGAYALDRGFQCSPVKLGDQQVSSRLVPVSYTHLTLPTIYSV
eukprot:TRINITY_DN9152_c0_g2_i1.p1 TRINITY_DN9152_c0_g2~~TRINITY_DN9152_c0_g2_i1.p1  ORF type:complete len:308 (-),score=47.22 TRINITY_DN9152_c0_g2_i1:34-897(-)